MYVCQWFTRSLHESKVGTLQILSKREVKMDTFSAWLIWFPKLVLNTYFRPTQYKVPLRMEEYCLGVLMSCLTALRESITRGWILSQGSALMLQDSLMMKNTGRIITRILCFHLLIKRYVLLNSHIFTFYLCYFCDAWGIKWQDHLQFCTMAIRMDDWNMYP